MNEHDKPFPVVSGFEPQDLVLRLRERARIRRQIPSRKSVQENKPDRIADLLEEAANEISRFRKDDLDRYEDARFRESW